MQKDELVTYWLDTSNRDYQTAKHLYDSDDYHWSLFIGHLVIEKLLKAILVARQPEGTSVPRSHDLLLLIEDTFALMRLRREVDLRIEPHPFLISDFTENNPVAREIMETGIRIL